jgi:hypothetical protein
MFLNSNYICKNGESATSTCRFCNRSCCLEWQFFKVPTLRFEILKGGLYTVFLVAVTTISENYVGMKCKSTYDVLCIFVQALDLE